jgi:hypothetical protein
MNKVVTRICKRIQKLERGIATNFLEIGALLVEVAEKGWLGDEMTLEELVETQFGFSMRLAGNLMTIQRVRAAYGIPDELLIGVGRSKIARLASRLTEENWATTLEWAGSTTFNKVNESVKSLNEADGDGRSFRSTPNSGDSAQRILQFSRKQRDDFDEVIDIGREKFNMRNREAVLIKVLRLVKPLL